MCDVHPVSCTGWRVLYVCHNWVLQSCALFWVMGCRSSVFNIPVALPPRTALSGCRLHILRSQCGGVDVAVVSHVSVPRRRFFTRSRDPPPLVSFDIAQVLATCPIQRRLVVAHVDCAFQKMLYFQEHTYDRPRTLLTCHDLAHQCFVGVFIAPWRAFSDRVRLRTALCLELLSLVVEWPLLDPVLVECLLV